MLYGSRAITEGAWFKVNKRPWNTTRVLDVTKLSKQQLTDLEKVFDRLSTAELMPLSVLAKDPIRLQIDENLCNVLKLPDLRVLRELIVNELEYLDKVCINKLA